MCGIKTTDVLMCSEFGIASCIVRFGLWQSVAGLCNKASICLELKCGRGANGGFVKNAKFNLRPLLFLRGIFVAE